MLWIALAVMTGLAMAFVLWPLAARGRDNPDDAREAAFYRAQIDEIGRDVERGVLPPQEAASARAEAARRLLAVGESRPVAAPTGALWRRRAAAVAIFIVTPALALGVYQRIGAPDLPDEPLSQRKMDLNAPGGIEAAVAKIEAHLMKDPGDRRGWEVLAPIYMRLGRFGDAGGAYRRMLALGDETPPTHAKLGEALVAMSDGTVTTEARGEFEKARDLPMAQFYLALGLEQDGKTDEAKAAYAALAPQAKDDAPWVQGLRGRLAALNGGAAPAPAQAEAPAFSPDQRKMIEGMVSGLADRLATKGGSAEEWTRLIRAYSVLHEGDKARDALASARKALGPNSGIDALARDLGI